MHSALRIIAVLAIAATAQAAEARTFKVAYLSEPTMASICKGNGTFTSGVNSYACTYKNGNVRECNRSTKQCITDQKDKT